MSQECIRNWENISVLKIVSLLTNISFEKPYFGQEG